MLKKILEKLFEDYLRSIIQQGNNKEYQKLINTIVKIHREKFTEENIYTTKRFLQELLDEACNKKEMW